LLTPPNKLICSHRRTTGVSRLTECQTMLDFAASRDDGGGGDDNRNSLSRAKVQVKSPPYQCYTFLFIF